MGRCSAVVLAAAAIAVASASAGASVPRDVPVRLYVDGRRFDAGSPSADLRGGKAFVNLVRAVKAFNGLLTFVAPGTTRATFGGRTIEFRIGRTTAKLDGQPVPLPAAPFIRSGDPYVPLATVGRLVGAKVRIDQRRDRAYLTSGQGDVFPPAAAASESGASDEDAPTLAQALALVPSLVALPAGGVEARLDVTNRTGKAYAVPVAGPAAIQFVVEKAGAAVWTAPAGVGIGQLRLEGFGMRHFAARWDAAPPGRYVLRARIITAVPIVTTPVSLDYATPRPQ